MCQIQLQLESKDKIPEVTQGECFHIKNNNYYLLLFKYSATLVL